ncbi:predicted protein [Arabidopsis lyrata subsp. lyrata]|uniref:Predicted protein n=1 Tax=Arabidopsis lyrata subsp. lyrata TaxID=81972 RepID=D7L580_ARALL|nr:predicted protein [Arabidopsis lyrata subsp. lyrata]
MWTWSNSWWSWFSHQLILKFSFQVFSGGYGITGAIAGGVAAGAALLFDAPAIAFACRRRRKPQDIFFDVPGEFIIRISFY